MQGVNEESSTGSNQKYSGGVRAAFDEENKNPMLLRLGERRRGLFVDPGDGLFHAREIAGLEVVVLRRETLGFPFDRSFPVIRIRMVGQKLRSVRSAFCIQFLEKVS